MRLVYDWSLISHQTPTGLLSPQKGNVHIQGVRDEPGGHHITTSPVVEILSKDQRKVKTKSGNIYFLAGLPKEWWVAGAGDSGIDDFAPFDVSVWGIVFLKEPTRGRISRNGCDWLWGCDQGENGLWKGAMVEDRECMVRTIHTDFEFKEMLEAKEAVLKMMEEAEKKAKGLRLFMVGGGVKIYRRDLS